MSAQPSTRVIALRASGLFSFAFFASAAANVLPQVYLSAVAPGRKSLMLCALLLLGTICAWGCIEMSRAQIERGWTLNRRRLLLGTLGSATPLAFVVTGAHPLGLYVALFVLYRAINSWLFNHVDNALISAAGERGVATHAAAATGFQLLGNMAGAVVFALLAGDPWVALIVLVVVSGWSAVTSWSALAGRGAAAAASGATWASVQIADASRHDASPASSTIALLERSTDLESRSSQTLASALSSSRLQQSAVAPRDRAASSRARLSGRGRLFIAYCSIIQVSMLGMFAQVIFLAKDWLRLPAPERVGGLLMLGIGLTSVVSVALITRLYRGAYGRPSLMIAALLMAASTALLGLRPGPSGLVAVALLAGAGGGAFVLFSRTIASTWSGPAGRVGMLGRYNNVPNVASLIAFLSLASLAAGLGEQHPLYNPSLLTLFTALFTVGALLATRLAVGPGKNGQP